MKKKMKIIVYLILRFHPMPPLWRGCRNKNDEEEEIQLIHEIPDDLVEDLQVVPKELFEKLESIQYVTMIFSPVLKYIIIFSPLANHSGTRVRLKPPLT